MLVVGLGSRHADSVAERSVVEKMPVEARGECRGSGVVDGPACGNYRADTDPDKFDREIRREDVGAAEVATVDEDELGNDAQLSNLRGSQEIAIADHHTVDQLLPVRCLVLLDAVPGQMEDSIRPGVKTLPDLWAAGVDLRGDRDAVGREFGGDSAAFVTRTGKRIERPFAIITGMRPRRWIRHDQRRAVVTLADHGAEILQVELAYEAGVDGQRELTTAETVLHQFPWIAGGVLIDDQCEPADVRRVFFEPIRHEDLEQGLREPGVVPR